MENNIKFSIIVPVYNVENYLRDSIDSILEQTYKEYEIILIDDGSTDSSGVICDEYSEKDRRVRVFHQENQGLSVARNQGIDYAKGQYLLFLDSDDYWYNKQALEIIAVRLKKSCVDVLSFNYIKFTDNNFESPYFKQKDNMPLELLKMDTLEYQIENDLWIACAWNKVIKRKLFEDKNLYFKNGVTSEDIDWCLRLALTAESFDFIKAVIVCYRQRATSISKDITVRKIDMLIDNIENCLNILEKDKEKSKVLKPYVSYQYGTALYYVSTINEKEEYNRLLSRLKKNKHILRWSKNYKIRWIGFVYSIGGMKFVMALLRLRERIK